MSLKITEDIRSVTELKRRTRGILEQVHRTRRPVVLTVNGKADSVLIDARTYEKHLKASNLSRLLLPASKTSQEGVRPCVLSCESSRMPASFKLRSPGVPNRYRGDLDFIAADSADAATKFINELENQAAALARFPERCPLIPENELLGSRYRHFLHGHYRTIFRVHGRTVYVLRVIHGARLLDTSMFEIDR